MKDKDLIEEHTPEVSHCGECERGEKKFAVITDDGLYLPNNSVIRKVNLELLEELGEGKEQ